MMLESSANCGEFVEYGNEVQIVDRSCWISILFVFLLNKFRSSISIQRQASFFPNYLPTGSKHKYFTNEGLC